MWEEKEQSEFPEQNKTENWNVKFFARRQAFDYCMI